MSHKRRLRVLECITLESQIARIREHYRSLTEADLDLILEIADGQKTGIWPREYSADEVELFNRHCEFMTTIPDVAHDESTRRTLAELLTTGRIDRAEILERWGPEYLPKSPKGHPVGCPEA